MKKNPFILFISIIFLLVSCQSKREIRINELHLESEKLLSSGLENMISDQGLMARTNNDIEDVFSLISADSAELGLDFADFIYDTSQDTAFDNRLIELALVDYLREMKSYESNKLVSGIIEESDRIFNLEFHRQKADSLYNIRHFNEAFKELDSVLLFATYELGEIQFSKGIWHLERKMYKDAIESYSVTIDKQYELSSCYYQRALCYKALMDYEHAAIDLRKAMGLSHPDAEELYEKINPERKRVSYYVTRCCDGSTSSATGRGACSHHGGVCNWNDPVYETYRKY
ncbi:MAG: hypothetical protein QNK23_11485 [Crocinitomicaceae bacterium]|nr:hypothetical protein [Crocinitomicaceae bacterium]